MYSNGSPGGKSYLYHRTLKKACPHLLKLVNKEKNRKTSLGAIRGGSYNIHANGVQMQIR
jgi:hypothetical protein